MSNGPASRARSSSRCFYCSTTRSGRRTSPPIRRSAGRRRRASSAGTKPPLIRIRGRRARIGAGPAAPRRPHVLTRCPKAPVPVLINHWPLRYDLARPPRIPRFSLWCGTTITEDWGQRFRARAVVSGHLHLRTTMVRHGIRVRRGVARLSARLARRARNKLVPAGHLAGEWTGRESIRAGAGSLSVTRANAGCGVRRAGCVCERARCEVRGAGADAPRALAQPMLHSVHVLSAAALARSTSHVARRTRIPHSALRTSHRSIMSLACDVCAFWS